PGARRSAGVPAAPHDRGHPPRGPRGAGRSRVPAGDLRRRPGGDRVTPAGGRTGVKHGCYIDPPRARSRARRIDRPLGARFSGRARSNYGVHARSNSVTRPAQSVCQELTVIHNTRIAIGCPGFHSLTLQSHTEMVLLSAHPEGIPAMISRKVLVAAGAVSAATLFFGPAVASAESVTGVTGSAALATGSAGLAAGSAEAGAAAGAAGGLGTGSAALAAGSAEGGAALGSAEGLATGS